MQSICDSARLATYLEFDALATNLSSISVQEMSLGVSALAKREELVGPNESSLPMNAAVN
jgi:hypothetical protein